MASNQQQQQQPKKLQFNDDISIDVDNPLNYCKIEIPFNLDKILYSRKQILLFKQTLRQLFESKKFFKEFHDYERSFTETLAYRLFSCIDWTSTTASNEIETLIKPLINSKFINLESYLGKNYGYFIKLTKDEVKKAIHDWSAWRMYSNDKLIDLYFNNLDDLSYNNENFNELLSAYVIAKWSTDETKDKFDTYVHYGIPRARLRNKPDVDHQ